MAHMGTLTSASALYRDLCKHGILHNLLLGQVGILIRNNKPKSIAMIVQPFWVPFQLQSSYYLPVSLSPMMWYEVAMVAHMLVIWCAACLGVPGHARAIDSGCGVRYEAHLVGFRCRGPVFRLCSQVLPPDLRVHAALAVLEASRLMLPVRCCTRCLKAAAGAAV